MRPQSEPVDHGEQRLGRRTHVGRAVMPHNGEAPAVLPGCVVNVQRPAAHLKIPLDQVRELTSYV
jgi:hypothetical protein